MEDKKYNGWTNWETWLVALHFEPQTKQDVDFLRENIEAMFEEISKDDYFLKDVLSGFEVCINWEEIASHLDDEEDGE
jgi:hypothetical protein